MRTCLLLVFIAACTRPEPFRYKDEVLDRWFDLEPESSPQGDALVDTFGTTCVYFTSDGTLNFDSTLQTLPDFAWSESPDENTLDINRLGQVTFSKDEDVEMEFQTGVPLFSPYDGSRFTLDPCWWSIEQP